MKVQNLQVLVMPNDEVLYMGKTLGFINHDPEAVKRQEFKQVQISPSHLSDVNN